MLAVFDLDAVDFDPVVAVRSLFDVQNIEARLDLVHYVAYLLSVLASHHIYMLQETSLFRFLLVTVVVLHTLFKGDLGFGEPGKTIWLLPHVNVETENISQIA